MTAGVSQKMKLDYFTIRRKLTPRKRWQENNKWFYKCVPPHFTWNLQQVMRIVSGKEAMYGYTLKSLQKRIDE